MDLVGFLSTVELFKSMPLSFLSELSKELVEVSVLGGETLFREGEEADCLYIVLQGRLKVHQFSLLGEKNYLGEIGQGQLLGEIALLTDKKRTATIIAIRDTTLLKFSKSCFDSFVLKHPDILVNFTKECVNRLIQKPPAKGGHNSLRTLAVVPAGGSVLGEAFISEFIEALSIQGSVLYLSSKEERSLDAGWLIEQEKQYRYIVYEADGQLTDWTKLCLRQADRVLFVASESASIPLNEIEDFFFKSGNEVVSELIFLHEKIGSLKSHAQLWVDLRLGIGLHHLCIYSKQDFARLIRFISGKAIGLVLAGGGARGLAHVGVIRALEELKIPIDYVGGTSMGSAIAAGVACGMDYKKILDCVEKQVVPAALALDYTLPFLALKSGKNVARALKNVFDESLYIEDCPINFFCVSTNVSRQRPEIHHRGILWKAVRASLSIPAIFPPIINENGELLVDGGIVNNLPVDVMRGCINGGLIISVSFSFSDSQTYESLPLEVSGWRMLKNRLFHKSQKNQVPNIGEIIVSVMTLSSNSHQKLMEKAADCSLRIACPGIGLMEFDAFKQIVDIGYESSIDKLRVFFQDIQN